MQRHYELLVPLWFLVLVCTSAVCLSDKNLSVCIITLEWERERGLQNKNFRRIKNEEGKSDNLFISFQRSIRFYSNRPPATSFIPLLSPPFPPTLFLRTTSCRRGGMWSGLWFDSCVSDTSTKGSGGLANREENGHESPCSTARILKGVECPFLRCPGLENTDGRTTGGN